MDYLLVKDGYAFSNEISYHIVDNNPRRYTSREVVGILRNRPMFEHRQSSDRRAGIKWRLDMLTFEKYIAQKGYTQRALAEILCEKHSCKISTALHWFGRITANPPRWAQKAIVLLNNELPSIDWKKAIDNLLNSGYTKTELSRILSRETGCKFRTAIHWFAKRQLPPLKMRIAIVELEKNLLS